MKKSRKPDTDKAHDPPFTIPSGVLIELHAGVKRGELARDEAESAYRKGASATGDVALRDAELEFLNVIARAMVSLVAAFPRPEEVAATTTTPKGTE